MRKPIIVGNWKMNKTIAETKAFVEAVDAKVSDSADWGIATPYLALQAAKEGTKKLLVAAENCHFKDSGAYTGEVSVEMLKEIGVEWVILGHSERRQYFGETDETVNLQAKKALEKGLIPIVCCGESLEQREAGITMDWIAIQIKKAFAGISADDAKKVVVAYEPIWAIGTGKTATDDQAEEVCGGIRELLENLYDAETAKAITIQYGGSMNPKNCAGLLAKPNIDGGLIGGASLKSADFAVITKAAK